MFISGVARHDAHNLMMYSVTVDTKDIITRSDKGPSGTIAVFEIFCFGRSTTTANNLQGAFQNFKNICSHVKRAYNPPKFVKLGRITSLTISNEQ